MMRKVLLICGIASSLLYVAMTIVIAMLWKAYSSASQTISELSAIDAPTRSLWMPRWNHAIVGPGCMTSPSRASRWLARLDDRWPGVATRWGTSRCQQLKQSSMV
jgi:hypothetical protein